MCDRIWYELVDAKYRQEYLILHIDKLERRNKGIDNFLMLSTFAGIFGWYKFAEYNVFWASLLAILTGFRLMKTKFLTPDQEINTLKAVYEFYVDHVRKLENLWIKYYNNKINEEDAEIQFEKLRDEERLMTKINKHNKVHGEEPIKSIAKNQTDAYLSKISNQ